MAALGASEARAALPLRIAMSNGDVSSLSGGPKAGLEGVCHGSNFVCVSLAL